MSHRGAFTPTCTDLHLPGFIRAAPRFERLGVDTLAVITTNDRFIMSCWKDAMKECMEAEGLKSLDDKVTMIADKDGEIIKVRFACARLLSFSTATRKTCVAQLLSAYSARTEKHDRLTTQALGFMYNSKLDRKAEGPRAAWQMFNSGLRSKRFALVVQDGVVKVKTSRS